MTATSDHTPATAQPKEGRSPRRSTGAVTRQLIGIDRQGISPVHTHDSTGVIHVESPVKRTFTLGEFFTEWGVSSSADSIGGLRAGDGKTLRAFVNGNPVTGNPAALPLNAHDEIILIYGTAQPGESIPAHYDFAAGL
jgi:hypothetical protein